MEARKNIIFLMVFTIVLSITYSGFAEKEQQTVDYASRFIRDLNNTGRGNHSPYNSTSEVKNYYGGLNNNISGTDNAQKINSFVVQKETFVCDRSSAAVEWFPTTVQGAQAYSHCALVGGYENSDRSPLWVIRAWFNDGLLPGKLSVRNHKAYVPWGGFEHEVQNIEVCCVCRGRLRWVDSKDGIWWDPNAVPGGHTSSGEPLLIGRAMEQGSLIPGKVHPSEQTMYLSYDNREIRHNFYELLITA